MGKLTLSHRQLISLAFTIGICCLTSLEKILQPHTAAATRIKAVIASLAHLAQLFGTKLTPEMADLGMGAWQAAMDYISANISEDC